MKKNESKLNLILDELISLSESITNYFAGQLQDYLSLITYLQQLSSEFNSFGSKIKLPKSYTENKSPNNLGINSFFDLHSYLNNDIHQISEKINKNILTPLQSFKGEFESDNKLIFFSLNSIVEEISSKKNNLQNKEIKDDYLINIEKNLDKVITSFEEIEQKKNKIIYNSLLSFYNLFYKENLIGQREEDFKNILKKYKNKIDTQKTMKDIFPNYSILKSKKSNKNDDWVEINYEKKYNNNTYSNINNNNNANIKTAISEYYVPQIVIKNNIIGIDDEYMVFNSAFNKNQKESEIIDIIESEEKIKDNIIINNFLYGLDIQSPKNDILLSIEDVFGKNIGNKLFYIDFINKIILARGVKKTLYEIKIFSNLVFLTNVMNLIIENIKDDLISNRINEDILNSFKILDDIICIGEKSVSENIYMCALLSKNKIFKDKKIWINSIKNKIIILLNELCTKEYLSKEKETIFKNGEINIDISKKNIKKFFGEIRGLLLDEKKNLIEICGFNKYIKYYNKLTKEQKTNLDKNALSIFHGVIKCYIRHITNYNFSLDSKADIISEICANLNITDDSHVIFYCYYYQDCLLTSKKNNYKNISKYSTKIREKINFIKSGVEEIIPKEFEINIKNDGNKYFIIKSVSKYLNDKDKIKLIGLGKYFMKIKKYIYKQFLEKDIPLEKRLNIWKSYLKFKSIASLYNYKKILEETQTDFFKKSNEKSIIQIKKDINRTYLRKGNDDFPKILYNILTSFVYCENKINYVQGINSIVGFIYDLTQNEEQTFLLLICIFNYTQLRDIYDDEEFHNLKILFYSMERILYLYLPKIYSKLKDNNLQISFFMSAYFITLFTILYPHMPKNDSSFIAHIWDDFILEGWKSFFSAWLAILSFYENEFLNYTGDLLNFLTNKIKDSKLFKKENYGEFCEIKNKFAISDELMKNLKYEISAEIGIRNVGTSTIIEDFNEDDKKK